MKNEKEWTRRNIHIDEEGVHVRMTLWNNQVVDIGITCFLNIISSGTIYQS